MPCLLEKGGNHLTFWSLQLLRGFVSLPSTFWAHTKRFYYISDSGIFSLMHAHPCVLEPTPTRFTKPTFHNQLAELGGEE
jgi:hypothetical protein